MGGITKGHRDILSGDGYIHYIDCANDFIDMNNMYISLKYHIVHSKYVQLITYQLHLNKTLKIKNLCLHEFRWVFYHIYLNFFN